MAQHGGKRAGAGRKPGAVSKAKRALSERAKDKADDALDTLYAVMQDDEQPGATRIQAANALLDRGYGKPPQSLEHSGLDGGPIQTEEVSARDVLSSKLNRLATGSGSDGDAGGSDGGAS